MYKVETKATGGNLQERILTAVYAYAVDESRKAAQGEDVSLAVVSRLTDQGTWEPIWCCDDISGHLILTDEGKSIIEDWR